MKRRLSFVGVLVLFSSTSLVAADDPDTYRRDPTKVLGADNCAECHAPINEAWKKTHHFDTFLSMHTRPEAETITGKMGIRLIKRESLCIRCHYTAQQEEGDRRAKVIAGISCESCHGASAAWNKIHSDKDDPMALAKAEKLGLIRPHDTYAVAANCFSCHTVPEEELVNKGGHKAGSDFELVSWSQGEVRHNLQADPKMNKEASPERKRMLYIVGRALDLEFGLRGLAKATQEGAYAQAMTKRVQDAKARLEEVQKAANSEEIKAIVAAVPADALKINNQDALAKIADEVGKLTKQFASSHDGSKLAAVDPLVPKADSYKGPLYQP